MIRAMALMLSLLLSGCGTYVHVKDGDREFTLFDAKDREQFDGGVTIDPETNQVTGFNITSGGSNASTLAAGNQAVLMKAIDLIDKLSAPVP